MAHTCPECGQTCYCCGDIDDIAWNDDSDEAMDCEHWRECESEGDEYYGDDERDQ